MTEVVTFDVFDTLLTRAIGVPTSLFLLLGRLSAVQAVTGVSAEEFARLRVEGERRARRTLRDITLADIYREVAVGLALTPEDERALCEAEIALELRLSRGVPSGRRRLEEHPGARRVAISDMYLPAATVRALLDRQGLSTLLDEVYVSSQTGRMKRTGELFAHVRDAEGWSTTRWAHVGDDARSDVKVPRYLGIAHRPMTSARLNRYEHIWESYRWETSGMTSLLAGASRLSRLAAPDTTPEQRAVVTVAAGVAAPVLTAYVLWVYRCARREGVKRLYFLARDGEVLYQVATRLKARLGWEVELVYLYGSRYAFHRAALADQELAEADWAWRSLYGLTNGQVLERLGLSAEDAEAALRRLGLHADARTPGIGEVLAADAQLAEQVRRAAVLARTALEQYLRQEGLADDVPFAVVDTGWEGRLVQSLHETLAPLGSEVRRAFFMGHLDRNKGFHDPSAIKGYFFDEAHGSGFLGATRQLRWLLEAFCAADHGMTVGYQTGSDGVVRPQLAADGNPALESWPWWQLYRQTVYAFVDEGAWEADLVNVAADLRRPVAEVLETFWEKPDATEAAVWGAFPFEDDLLAKTQHPLARPVRLRDFVRKAQRGYEGKRVWIPASVRLTPGTLRPVTRAGLWFAGHRQRHQRGEPVLPRHWRERALLARTTVRFRAAARRAGRGERHD